MPTAEMIDQLYVKPPFAGSLELPQADMLDQRDNLVAGGDTMAAGMAMRLPGIARTYRCDDRAMRLRRVCRSGPQLQRQHAGTMRLVGHGLGNAAQTAIAAALDEQAMETLVSLCPT